MHVAGSYAIYLAISHNSTMEDNLTCNIYLFTSDKILPKKSCLLFVQTCSGPFVFNVPVWVPSGVLWFGIYTTWEVIMERRLINPLVRGIQQHITHTVNKINRKWWNLKTSNQWTYSMHFKILPKFGRIIAGRLWQIPCANLKILVLVFPSKIAISSLYYHTCISSWKTLSICKCAK